jgi:hypothetical protein
MPARCTLFRRAVGSKISLVAMTTIVACSSIKTNGSGAAKSAAETTAHA